MYSGGIKIVNAKYRELNKDRWNKFLINFRKNGTEERVKLAKAQNLIPYNGFSFYKIIYKGEFPEYLLDAYHKMDELNSENPRKKFRKARLRIEKK